MVWVRTNTFTKVILGVLAGILVLLLIAEFGLRWFIGNQLAQNVESSDQAEQASISFGATPLLWGIATQNISNVEIDTPDSVVITYPDASEIPEIAGNPKTTVNLKNLSMADPDNPVAGHLTMTTFATDQFLLATIQREMALQQQAQQAQQPQTQGNPFENGEFDLGQLATGFLQNLIKITNITSNGSTGTVDVQITNGAAALTLRPEVVNGAMSFTAENASLFGFELPDSVSESLTKALSEGMGDTGTGMSITNIQVADGGIHLTMEGDNVNLNEIDASGTPQSATLPAEETATANS